MFDEFAKRSTRLERIDTGDYTAEEYEHFLKDIRVVNRLAGDNRALNKSLFRELKKEDLSGFSVLDLGAGSGELLRTCAHFARRTNRDATLFGLEFNKRSAQAILEESANFKSIYSIRADALELPFDDNTFDYVICSLFTHHFSESDIIRVLRGMSRIARRKLYVIDLHRHPAATYSYRLFCSAFIKSSLVKSDGELSILRGFKPDELEELANRADLRRPRVNRVFPFRLVLEAEC